MEEASNLMKYESKGLPFESDTLLQTGGLEDFLSRKLRAKLK